MVQIIFLSLALLLVGCDNRPILTRAQVIEGIKECNDAGLSATITKTPFGGRQVNVRCFQRRDVWNGKAWRPNTHSGPDPSQS